MTDRPDVAQILSDQLRSAGMDRLTAANIVATVGAAVIAQIQWDDMERWRDAQNMPASPPQSTLPHEPAHVDHTATDTNNAQQALQQALAGVRIVVDEHGRLALVAVPSEDAPQLGNWVAAEVHWSEVERLQNALTEARREAERLRGEMDHALEQSSVVERSRTGWATEASRAAQRIARAEGVVARWAAKIDTAPVGYIAATTVHCELANLIGELRRALSAVSSDTTAGGGE